MMYFTSPHLLTNRGWHKHVTLMLCMAKLRLGKPPAVSPCIHTYRPLPTHTCTPHTEAPPPSPVLFFSARCVFCNVNPAMGHAQDLGVQGAVIDTPFFTLRFAGAHLGQNQSP